MTVPSATSRTNEHSVDSATTIQCGCGHFHDVRRYQAFAVDAERQRIAGEVRALAPMRVIDTEYVPQAKRRPDAVIDRAAVLQIVNEVRGRQTEPMR